MRVIAGDLKGRRLDSVPGTETRPTTDKIKEAIFQMMGPFFAGGQCLDLFAGSGSLGIEAISRGMESAIFVDKNPKAVHIIKQNLKNLKVDNQAEVYRTDAFRALQAVGKRGLQFELILLDPPYTKVDYGKMIQEILDLDLLQKGGLIYAEHDPADVLPAASDSLEIIKRTDYSKTIGITIYKHL